MKWVTTSWTYSSSTIRISDILTIIDMFIILFSIYSSEYLCTVHLIKKLAENASIFRYKFHIKKIILFEILKVVKGFIKDCSTLRITHYIVEIMYIMIRRKTGICLRVGYRRDFLCEWAYRNVWYDNCSCETKWPYKSQAKTNPQISVFQKGLI